MLIVCTGMCEEKVQGFTVPGSYQFSGWLLQKMPSEDVQCGRGDDVYPM